MGIEDVIDMIKRNQKSEPIETALLRPISLRCNHDSVCINSISVSNSQSSRLYPQYSFGSKDLSPQIMQDPFDDLEIDIFNNDTPRLSSEITNDLQIANMSNRPTQHIPTPTKPNLGTNSPNVILDPTQLKQIVSNCFLQLLQESLSQQYTHHSPQRNRPTISLPQQYPPYSPQPHRQKSFHQFPSLTNNEKKKRQCFYWKQYGTCKNGDKCLFLHENVERENEKRENKQENEKTKPEKMESQEIDVEGAMEKLDEEHRQYLDDLFK